MPCRPLRARASLSLSLSLSLCPLLSHPIHRQEIRWREFSDRLFRNFGRHSFGGVWVGRAENSADRAKRLAPGRGTRNNRGGDDSDRESCPCTTSRLYRRCRPPRTSWTSSCRRRRGRRRRSCEENGRYRESGSSTWCELVLLASAPFQPSPCPPSAPCAARRPRPPLRVPQDLTLSLCSLFFPLLQRKVKSSPAVKVWLRDSVKVGVKFEKWVNFRVPKNVFFWMERVKIDFLTMNKS